MTQVAPTRWELPSSSELSAKLDFPVRWNKISVLISAAMLINIASMPLKAYLSEQVPWRASEAPEPVFANYSAFNAWYLASNQARFNRQTLAHASSYYVDDSTRTDVIRVALDMRTSQPESSCISFLLGLPGLIFYSGGFWNVLCSFEAIDHRNATLGDALRWDKVGACQYGKFASVLVGRQCVWLTTGNDLTGFDAPGVYTLTFTFQLGRFYNWLWCKFAYRVGLTCYVLRVMWRAYYRHCLHLARTLTTHGLQRRTPPCTSFEIVVGDPTALVLLNPIVSTAFTLDIWFSMEYMGIAMVRATQFVDLYTLFLAFLYFSRTVWFAYLALAFTSRCLKRYHKEHWFVEVDPTIVAVCVAVYSIPVDYLQANTVVVYLYYYLFRLPSSTDMQDHQVDVLFGCVLLTLLIAAVPIVYGFARARCSRKATTSVPYASLDYNSVKNRLLFKLVRSITVRRGLVDESGGSLYAAFAHDARYKMHPTTSLRSVDCFVLTKARGRTTHLERLSLLSSLDRLGSEAALAISVEKAATAERTFAKLAAHKSSFQLALGNEPSAWCS
ncbi:hypothetical protein SDRG_03856, partial [Saprolegnia diclina VS20]